MDDFNTHSLREIGHPDKLKGGGALELNNIVSQSDLADIYKAFHRNTKK